MALQMKGGILILVLSALLLRADAEPPMPGARFLNSPDFESRSAGEKRWAQRAIDSAAKEIVPRLLSAQSIVIYSLDPNHLDFFKPEVTNRRYFHGYPLLGKQTIWRKSDLEHFEGNLIQGLIPSEKVLCFQPRHAIRIHTGKSTTDMILCFECGKMRVFGLGPDASSDDYFFDVSVRDSLNEFLDASKIKRDLPKDHPESQ